LNNRAESSELEFDSRSISSRVKTPVLDPFLREFTCLEFFLPPSTVCALERVSIRSHVARWGLSIRSHDSKDVHWLESHETERGVLPILSSVLHYCRDPKVWQDFIVSTAYCGPARVAG
jgi:hypothetical protein